MTLTYPNLSIVQKVSILSLLFITLTSSILGIVLTNKSTQILVDRALGDITQIIQIIHDQGSELVKHVQSVKDDVRLISRLSALNNLLLTQSEKPEEFERLRSTLEQDFLALLQAKPSYLHVRYIDKYGFEIVRVDRKKYNGNVYAIPKSELQKKPTETM